MPIKSVKFNKTNLVSLIKNQTPVTVKDKEFPGLKFKVGKCRSVFQFEKRISHKSGKKSSPLTFTLGAFPAISIDEARHEARRIANLCEKGIDPRLTVNEPEEENHVVPLRDAIEKFFEVKKDIARRTARTYRCVIKHSFDPEWLDMNLLVITPEMIACQFHKNRLTQRYQCWKFLKVFGNIWNSCVPLFKDSKGEPLLKQSPIPETRILLKHIKPDQPQQTVIPVNLLGKYIVTLEQFHLLDLKIQRSKVAIRRSCDLLLLGLFTAFRFIEVQNLRWDYIDLDLGVIVLPGRVEDPNFLFEGTKNHQDHCVPLSTYAWDLLLRLHKERNPLSPYVFPSMTSPKKPTAICQKTLKELSRRLGCSVTPHANRRTFASVANEVGLGFLTVKRLLNHAFQGGVTGGYIVRGFNPNKEREHCQKVCDYLLDRRAAFLGQAAQKNVSQDEALVKLQRYAIELGLDPTEALTLIAQKKDRVA